MRVITSGVLWKMPESKTAPSGKTYTRATVRVPAKQRSEADPDSHFVLLTCFGTMTGEQLAKLTRGDAIAFAGPLDVGYPNTTASRRCRSWRSAKRSSMPDATLRPQRRDKAEALFRPNDAEGVAAMADDVPF